MATANSTQAEPPIASDGHKRCNKCGETKLRSEFYSNKKKSGGYKPACKCKACDNARRLALHRSPESLAKRKQAANCDEWRNKFGSDYGVRPCKKCGVNIWGIKPRRDFCEACFAIARDESKAARNDWKASWGRVCKSQSLELSRKADRESDPDIEWKRKCETAITSIRLRKRISNNRKKRRVIVCLTWKQASKRAKVSLKAKGVRSCQSRWSLKCETAARNHNRLARARLAKSLRHTASTGQ